MITIPGMTRAHLPVGSRFFKLTVDLSGPNNEPSLKPSFLNLIFELQYIKRQWISAESPPLCGECS